MAADAKQLPALFDATAFRTFRFVARELDARGHVTLRYALDEEIFFVEQLDLPIPSTAAQLDDADRERVDGLLSLLHWVAGVSYFKTALPPEVVCETGEPPPAAARLLDALYSEGLAELAYTNRLAALPRPRFPSEHARVSASGGAGDPGDTADEPQRLASDRRQPGRTLVPIGGGKDSAVALEIVRRSGRELA